MCLQIPHTDTEILDPVIRARQAVKFKPIELDAYQALTEDEKPQHTHLLS